MIKKKNKILVIFDLDGVLVDSLKLMKISWKEVQKKLDIKKPFSMYQKFIGLPFNSILKNMGIRGKFEDIYEIYNQTSIKKEKLLKLYSGVNFVLFKLKKKGYKTALVTSKNFSRTKRIIDNFKIPITNVNCPHKNYRGKPFPDQIFRAIKKSKLKPFKVFYVGDMQIDYKTSINSKIGFIFAKYGYETNIKTYKNSINSIKQLPKMLERLI